MKKLSTVILIMGLTLISQAQSTHTYSLAADVLWAKPEGFELTMDIYTPETGKSKYPVLVIFHGGGWLVNNKSIMNDMSKYVASKAEYVVCNVNYRLLGDQGNTVTMDEIIEDVLGATLWIQENIGKYKGDKDNIAVTGDSAGGHLASMVLLAGNQLDAAGFDKGPAGYNPSYLPKGKTVEKIMKSGGIQVQAAILSYGAFDIYAACEGNFESPQNGFWQWGGATARSIFGGEISTATHPEYYKKVSPVYNIPNATARKLPPQLCTVGALDNVTTPESVKAYVNQSKAAGQHVEYWEYEGRPHAFLDSGKNDFLGISFEKDAITALDLMIGFLDKVFY